MTITDMLRRVMPALVLVLAAYSQTFEVASVKPSAHAVGKDARGTVVVIGADRATARNISLKGIIVAAYDLQPFQVAGGPGWLDLDEFDLDARAGSPVSQAELRSMLQQLLKERFHLALHRDFKDMRVYALLIDKGGPKLHPTEGELRPTTSPHDFHGSMRQLANLISIQLSIPTVDDPTRPAIASGPPAPVLDKTELAGNYDISVDLRPDLGGDSFSRWQRVLRDDLGLKLESQRALIGVLVIDHVDRTPTAN